MYSKSFKNLTLTSPQSGRFKTKEEASDEKASLLNIESCQVKTMAKKIKSIGRPGALNTVNLLKYCTKNFGMSSHSAMQVAERLYLSGFMTYPRTETTSYPKNFNFKILVERLGNYDERRISNFAKGLLQVRVIFG